MNEPELFIDLGALPNSAVRALHLAAERLGGELGTVVLNETTPDQWGKGRKQFQRTVLKRIVEITVFESPDRANLAQLASEMEQRAPGGGSIFGPLDQLPSHQDVADALKTRTVRFLYGKMPNGCRIVGCLLGLGPVKPSGKKSCMALGVGAFTLLACVAPVVVWLLQHTS